MLRRIVAGVVVAFMILVMAVTPLSATFQPGYFDLRLQSWDDEYPMAVTLKDDTGLVSALTEGEWSPVEQVGLTRALRVQWDGDTDDNGIWMHFYPVDGGYRLTETTTKGASRPVGMGLGRTFVLVLRAPIDPATVEVDND
jgi:hypothetical protein